ncbi:hypothetical protein H310_05963 [Aphanomyces invadans]|uniref:Leucine-rich repeat and WD repeat-containing protein 1 LRR domain-containing protein n=1 Tax=Aphanomyces invadans TaxID=157072 RepID=A0A024U877_9STRA|nr:hypothetical protein H310_05963 [Aphanomyces invadans]ETW02454.1 hypothetical protein H310_05963 [Aphanomyces invadans]|eukprot:XP_008869059.1 hypothetical protein H310_05963 [Aphanomyces invadans]
MEITEDLLKRRSKHFDIACIQRLNLSGCDIATVALLEGCTSVVELNLSKNHLLSLRGIPTLSTLKSLDCSFNTVTTLDGMAPQPQLEELHLEGNELSRVDFSTLQKQLPRLRRLFLHAPNAPRSNPVCKMDKYMDIVHMAMPSLESLDGEIFALRQVSSDHRVKDDPERDADVRAALAEAAWEKVSWGLPPSDPTFVQKSTKKLKALLLECNSDLNGDSLELLQKMNVMLA